MLIARHKVGDVFAVQVGDVHVTIKVNKVWKGGVELGILRPEELQSEASGDAIESRAYCTPERNP